MYRNQVKFPLPLYDVEGMVPAAPSPEPATPAPEPEAPAWEGQAVWDYDPFEAPSEDAVPEPEAALVPEPPMGDESQSAPLQPEPEPTTNDQLVSVLAELRDKLATPAPAPSESRPETPPEPEDYFPDVAVPPALINAMASDDPTERQTATTLLVRGTMNMVMRKSVEMWQQFIREGLPELLEQHTTVQAQAKSIEQDFYGTYPKLNNPALKPLIATITQQEIQGLGQQYRGWTPELRDAIATKVLGLFAGLMDAPTQPASPQVQPFSPTPAARPVATPDRGAEDWRDFF